jgi:hypothetical protein
MRLVCRRYPTVSTLQVQTPAFIYSLIRVCQHDSPETKPQAPDRKHLHNNIHFVHRYPHASTSTKPTNITDMSNYDLSSMDLNSIFASFLLFFSLVWVVFLIYDYQTRTSRPSTRTSLGLYCHTIPSICLFIVCRVAQYATDSALVWFFALFAFRYWRTATNIFFWFQYRPAISSGFPTIMPHDCTVVVPTVGPSGNQVYDEVVAAILINQPLRLIFSTNTDSAAKEVQERLPMIISDIKSGISTYQMQHTPALRAPDRDHRPQRADF